MTALKRLFGDGFRVFFFLAAGSSRSWSRWLIWEGFARSPRPRAGCWTCRPPPRRICGTRMR
jgi:hypothetical protein